MCHPKLNDLKFIHRGKLEDFAAAARVLQGQKVSVATFLVPATERVYDAIHTQKVRERLFHSFTLGYRSCRFTEGHSFF